jgi:DNA-binding GntR family transcriptional regulator
MTRDEANTRNAVPSLKAVEIGALRHEVTDILREAVWEGVLKPGDRLNEQRLSEQLGVSRPPLREAIRVLEQEGLVESVARKGSFVRTFTGPDILEIYAVRCALEAMAAELAVENASADELDELESWIDRLETQGISRLAGSITQDLRFHRALVKLSHNGRLIQMWEQLAGQLRLALTLVDPAFFRTDYVEATHRPLVRAIRAGDTVEAKRIVSRLRDVGRSLEAKWEREPVTGDEASSRDREAK